MTGGEHERSGNSNLLADFSLGARADNWRVPYLGLTSRRLIEGPGDGLNEHPQPSHHRHCNCGKVEQFDHTGTHADSACTVPELLCAMADVGAAG